MPLLSTPVLEKRLIMESSDSWRGWGGYRNVQPGEKLEPYTERPALAARGAIERGRRPPVVISVALIYGLYAAVLFHMLLPLVLRDIAISIVVMI